VNLTIRAMETNAVWLMITSWLLIGLTILQLTETWIDGKLQRTAYCLTNIYLSTVPALILVDYT